MKIDKIPNWAPLVSLAAVSLIAWGAMGAQVKALADDGQKQQSYIERSIANEGKIEANARIIAGQNTQIQRTQQDIRAATAKIDRTQETLNTQQVEILLLLNRLAQ